MLKPRLLLGCLLLFISIIQGYPFFIDSSPALEKNMGPEFCAYHESEYRCHGGQDSADRKVEWEELMSRTAELSREGKDDEALPLAKEALRIAEITFGPAHINVAASLNNLGSICVRQGHAGEAVKLYQRALTIYEKALGPEAAEVLATLENLIYVHDEQGGFAEAETLIRRALSIREKALGRDQSREEFLTGLLGEAEALLGDGRIYLQALPRAREALLFAETSYGPEHVTVANSLKILAFISDDQGKSPKAESLFRRALSIQEKALGPDNSDVGYTLTYIANLYMKQKRYAEAEPLYRRALTIWEKAWPADDPSLAYGLDSLADVYAKQGRYAETEPLLRRALALREKVLDANDYLVAGSLENLASLENLEGRYAEAELLRRRALAIWEKTLGPEHPGVATALNDLAIVCYELGAYKETERLYRRALAIYEKALGPDHPDVATSLINLALLYTQQGRFSEAEPLALRSLAIREKAFGPESLDAANSLNNLAALYVKQGRFADADPLLRRNLAICEKALGPDHPFVAAALNNIGELSYTGLGKDAEAEPLLRRSLSILEKTFGPDNPVVNGRVMSLAFYYYAQGRSPEADAFFDRARSNIRRQLDQQFAYMSEDDRLAFLNTVSGFFPGYFSFCLTFCGKDPALIGKMYDVVLWQKGMVAWSAAALRAKIEASGDKDILALFEKLTSKKAQLAKLLMTPAADREGWRKAVTQLENEANELEKELVRRSAALTEEKKLMSLSWRDVQKALKPGEAAVEVVRFQFHDGRKWTGRAEYVALIVTPEMAAAPLLVDLGESKNLEDRPLREYRKMIGPDMPRPLPARAGFYEAFWKPLEPALGGARRIYFSPDGALSQVSLAVLPRSDGRLLIDIYDLRIVSSTKDLLWETHPSPSNSAVLIGDPDFALAEAVQRAAAQSLQKTEQAEPALMASTARGMRSRELGGAALPPLPGTAAELRTVDTLLEKGHWSVDALTGANALEESVKRVRSPRLLHVATHGFFEPDQKVKSNAIFADQPSGVEDPMLRSGLYFAGADRALSGAAPALDLEDGILTAYEASELNLQGTELVVLSACETGLGQEVAGEGVFGLRRALQVAGAEAVLMSMWSVPDQETQELMTLFYDKWLTGKSKAAALREAQLEMREKVRARYGEDLPLYWGAFVLVGR